MNSEELRRLASLAALAHEGDRVALATCAAKRAQIVGLVEALSEAERRRIEEAIGGGEETTDLALHRMTADRHRAALRGKIASIEEDFAKAKDRAIASFRKREAAAALLADAARKEARRAAAKEEASLAALNVLIRRNRSA